MNEPQKEKNQNKSLLDIVNSLSNNLTIAIQGINQQILLFVIAIALILIIFVITIRILSPDIPPLANIVLIIIGALAFVAMIIVFVLLLQKGRENKIIVSPQKTPEKLSNNQEVTKLPLSDAHPPLSDESYAAINKYEMLYELIGRFPRFKFEKLINALLSADELNFLPRPINMISKVEFLGYMKESGKLAEVEAYLRKNNPDLFQSGM